MFTVDKNLKTQYAVHISDTLVTLKRSQGHQARYESVLREQGLKRAMFERPRLNCVREKKSQC